MIITILEVFRDSSTEKMVRFSCSIGTAIGLWKAKQPPEIGAEYHIEFTIEPKIQIGKNATLLKKPQKSIQINGNDVELCGFIEDLDEDGVAYLRLGLDSLTMIATKGPEIVPGVYIKITLTTSQLMIYPYD